MRKRRVKKIMTISNTLGQVQLIIERYLGGIKLSQQDMDLPMLNFEIDSLGRLELLLKLEEELNISLEGADILDRNITIRGFIDTVLKNPRRD